MLPYRKARNLPPKKHGILLLSMSLLAVISLFMLFYLGWTKCDTRVPMTSLLKQTSSILQKNDIEYWLDKGTLLGAYREDGLIPWEYDIDIGVMNKTCDALSTLKDEFKKVGLELYDRSDEIPHKVKLTYDTENHYFYYSDSHIHDPCVRIYDANDHGVWVDVYWYITVPLSEIKATPDSFLIPEHFGYNEELVCCSEGLTEFTEHMCCGGCVPKSAVFPLTTDTLSLPNEKGESDSLQFPMPANTKEYLSTIYGTAALRTRAIKGWKVIVCGYWTHPVFFLFQWLVIFGMVGIVFVYFLKRNLNSSDKQN